ncbi:MAG: competence type IV pilus major pilin ComGC [Sarcina sp.]
MIKRNKKKGFTLIELVIVLAVLAIIALIAIPNFTRVRNNALVQADDTSCEQITNIMQTAVAEGVISPVIGQSYVGVIIEVDESVAKVKTETPKYRIKISGTALPYNSKFTEPEAALRDHLRDIESPQEAGKTEYIVDIAADGSISTKTGPEPEEN